MRIGITFVEAYGVMQPESRHDAEKAVVFDMKLLGLESKNGKRYLPQATRKAKDLLEGQTSYIDHASEKPLSPTAKPARSILNRFARVKNVHYNDKGEAFCDYHYRPKHPFAEQFKDLVDNDPVGIGLSINAFGYGTRDSDGTYIIDEIVKVHSVDLVDDPATCSGIWEQTMDTAIDPVGGAVTTGTDWRSQAGDLLKSIATDSSLDKKAMRKKVMQVLKLLDDPEEAGPADDGALMEQLREIADPVARKAVGRLDALFLRERRETRRQQAVDAKLPAYALTEQFIDQITSAPAEKVPELILDRQKLINAAKTPSAPAPTLLVEQADPFNKVKTGEEYKEKVKELSASIFGG